MRRRHRSRLWPLLRRPPAPIKVLLFLLATIAYATAGYMLFERPGKPEIQWLDALWWSVVFGANLGGNLTPIGSASTLVAVTIIHKYKIALSFTDFVKIALPYAVMQIAIAVVYVLLFLA